MPEARIVQTHAHKPILALVLSYTLASHVCTDLNIGERYTLPQCTLHINPRQSMTLLV